MTPGYELIPFLETNGGVLQVDPSGWIRAQKLLMHHIPDGWLVASFGEEIPTPGWPHAELLGLTDRLPTDRLPTDRLPADRLPAERSAPCPSGVISNLTSATAAGGAEWPPAACGVLARPSGDHAVGV